MFWRKKKVKDNSIVDTEPQRKVVRKIINGKLYDTSKAQKICHILISHRDIPEYKLIVCNLCGEEVDIYIGSTEFFLEYSGVIQPVTEEWGKEVLGKRNVDKYIELFGEPELA